VKLPTVKNCDGCGVCCFHMGYPSFVDGTGDTPAESHWVRLPESLRLELVDYQSRYQQPADGQLDGPCFWLDRTTGLCRHHEYRPNVCRDFEVGCTDCLDWRKHYQIGT
jgi:Fe-S-cluster containining protein